MFDNDPHKVGLKICEKEVYHISELENMVQKNNIKIAILAIPEMHAQKIANLLVKSGIKAIWNFAPTSIEVPKDIVVSNHDLGSDFVVLSARLGQYIY
jgi:redox-sensing transcriptional repressor